MLWKDPKWKNHVFRKKAANSEKKRRFRLRGKVYEGKGVRGDWDPIPPDSIKMAPYRGRL